MNIVILSLCFEHIITEQFLVSRSIFTSQEASSQILDAYKIELKTMTLSAFLIRHRYTPTNTKYSNSCVLDMCRRSFVCCWWKC